ncbi:Mitogen-activated protein kinase kinase 4 [Diplonema papillatum]|nr:Mitogen-activated protein kinase kinase 4 [Diplonema papillatum]KAJ9448007.1 Mitogen-activated protein kinase kinase 4 [Diplonema papillatum]
MIDPPASRFRGTTVGGAGQRGGGYHAAGKPAPASAGGRGGAHCSVTVGSAARGGKAGKGYARFLSPDRKPHHPHDGSGALQEHPKGRLDDKRHANHTGKGPQHKDERHPNHHAHQGGGAPRQQGFERSDNPLLSSDQKQRRSADSSPHRKGGGGAGGKPTRRGKVHQEDPREGSFRRAGGEHAPHKGRGAGTGEQGHQRPRHAAAARDDREETDEKHDTHHHHHPGKGSVKGGGDAAAAHRGARPGDTGGKSDPPSRPAASPFRQRPGAAGGTALAARDVGKTVVQYGGGGDWAHGAGRGGGGAFSGKRAAVGVLHARGAASGGKGGGRAPAVGDGARARSATTGPAVGHRGGEGRQQRAPTPPPRGGSGREREEEVPVITKAGFPLPQRRPRPQVVAIVHPSGFEPHSHVLQRGVSFPGPGGAPGGLPKPPKAHPPPAGPLPTSFLVNSSDEDGPETVETPPRADPFGAGVGRDCPKAVRAKPPAPRAARGIASDSDDEGGGAGLELVSPSAPRKLPPASRVPKGIASDSDDDDGGTVQNSSSGVKGRARPPVSRIPKGIASDSEGEGGTVRNGSSGVKGRTRPPASRIPKGIGSDSEGEGGCVQNGSSGVKGRTRPLVSRIPKGIGSDSEGEAGCAQIVSSGAKGRTRPPVSRIPKGIGSDSEGEGGCVQNGSSGVKGRTRPPVSRIPKGIGSDSEDDGGSPQSGSGGATSRPPAPRVPLGIGSDSSNPDEGGGGSRADEGPAPRVFPPFKKSDPQQAQAGLARIRPPPPFPPPPSDGEYAGRSTAPPTRAVVSRKLKQAPLCVEYGVSRKSELTAVEQAHAVTKAGFKLPDRRPAPPTLRVAQAEAWASTEALAAAVAGSLALGVTKATRPKPADAHAAKAGATHFTQHHPRGDGCDGARRQAAFAPPPPPSPPTPSRPAPSVQIERLQNAPPTITLQTHHAQAPGRRRAKKRANLSSDIFPEPGRLHVANPGYHPHFEKARGTEDGPPDEGDQTPKKQFDVFAQNWSELTRAIPHFTVHGTGAEQDTVLLTDSDPTHTSPVPAYDEDEGIPYDDVDITSQLIGSGAQGSVLKCLQKSTKKPLALKKIDLNVYKKDQLAIEQQAKQVSRELSMVFAHYECPYIVKAHNAFCRSNCLLILFEFMDWSLEQLRDAVGQIPYEKVVGIAKSKFSTKNKKELVMRRKLRQDEQGNRSKGRAFDLAAINSFGSMSSLGSVPSSDDVVQLLSEPPQSTTTTISPTHGAAASGNGSFSRAESISSTSSPGPTGPRRKPPVPSHSSPSGKPRVVRKTPVPERVIAVIGFQILKGLEYLHSLRFAEAAGVVHKDIKPGNILINAKGKAKIADFGCCSFVDESGHAPYTPCGAGTQLYMAPENLHGHTTADLWSLGITLLELADGCHPIPTARAGPWIHAHTLDSVVSDVRPDCVDFIWPSEEYDMSEDLKDFITKCLQRDATKRVTAAQLLEHPFLSDVTPDEFPRLAQWAQAIMEYDREVQVKRNKRRVHEMSRSLTDQVGKADGTHSMLLWAQFRSCRTQGITGRVNLDDLTLFPPLGKLQGVG